ncbi:MAG: hypothetical protein JO323_02840 [Acidobacteriia bacterium]|nr:hypothetical protein [Terriglobia bacterium]
MIGRLPRAILPPMQVTLTPHGAELVEAALARGLGRSPEEVVERALETIAGEGPVLDEEEKERRHQAVDGMRRFGEKHHLTLGPGERIKDLLHEGHKF